MHYNILCDKTSVFLKNHILINLNFFSSTCIQTQMLDIHWNYFHIYLCFLSLHYPVVIPVSFLLFCSDFNAWFMIFLWLAEEQGQVEAGLSCCTNLFSLLLLSPLFSLSAYFSCCSPALVAACSNWSFFAMLQCSGSKGREAVPPFCTWRVSAVFPLHHVFF